jgi:hypothetical protein
MVELLDYPAQLPRGCYFVLAKVTKTVSAGMLLCAQRHCAQPSEAVLLTGRVTFLSVSAGALEDQGPAQARAGDPAKTGNYNRFYTLI